LENGNTLNSSLEGMDAASDWMLMARLAQGEHRALGEIIARHERALLSFAFRYLGDAEEARDMVQEVFVRAYRNAGTYRPDAQLRTWLFRICMNVCLTALRRRRRSPLFAALAFWQIKKDREPEQSARIEAVAVPPEGLPGAALLRKELSRQVRVAVDRLPPEQKTAILLRHFDELSYREIAQVLGRSVSAVESLLFRARQRLAKELKAYVDL
jgi:RNA polymerase sigma-70 factor, ECF subfamily